MQSEEDRIAAFCGVVAEGEAQLDRGAGTEYSRERMNELADTARKNLGGSKPIDPSSPEYRLVLSPKTEQDIEPILRYTREEWGEKRIASHQPGNVCFTRGLDR